MAYTLQEAFKNLCFHPMLKQVLLQKLGHLSRHHHLCPNIRWSLSFVFWRKAVVSILNIKIAALY